MISEIQKPSFKHGEVKTKNRNGNECDSVDASAVVLANALVDTPPKHDQRVGRHTTNTPSDRVATNMLLIGPKNQLFYVSVDEVNTKPFSRIS